MNASTAPATLEQAQDMGLTADEFKKIEEILGRTPNFTEMCIYSVMWSEHCSYKNSIKYLKTLPKEGPHMLVKAGEENAGIVDIGDGLGCAFKIESHNHPFRIGTLPRCGDRRGRDQPGHLHHGRAPHCPTQQLAVR